MKQLIALVSYVLITMFAGVTNSELKNLKHRYELSAPNSTKIIETDTIKPIFSNRGNPYITNYDLEINNQQVWSICQDNSDQMVFAHRRGLTIFNGSSWEEIMLPAIPISLKNLPEQNLILVGCDNQYGYIKLDETGIYKYTVLSDTEFEHGEITDIKVTESYIYFYSDESLSVYNRETLKKENEWGIKDGVRYNGIIQLGDDVFISKENKGIYKVELDGKRKFIPRSKGVSRDQLAFSIQFSDNAVLLGTYENRLFKFDGKRLLNYQCAARNYIVESQLVGGINLDATQFALSTLSGGIVIINKAGGQIAQVINYQNGLPDDEVFATGIDKEGGLWVSHGFGISRVNYDLPVKDFNYYPGIEGKLIDVIVFDNTSYIATTKGVFYLDTLTSVKEFDIYIKKKSLKKNTAKKDAFVESKVVKNEKRKSVFQKWKERREKRKKRRLDKKKNENLNVTIKIAKPKKRKEKPKKNTKIVYRKKTMRVLSLSYVFKKVKDISGKCKQLVRYNQSLLVATNNGLYEIKKKKAKKIFKNVYVNTIVPSKTKGAFYIGTDKGFSLIKVYGKGWKEYRQIQPEGFNDEVLSIAEDENNNIWLGSDALIYYITVGKRHKAESFEIFDFGKTYPDKFSVRQIEGQIFFLSSSQIYLFDKNKGRIEPSDKLIPNTLPYLEYIISQPGITWLKNEGKWVFISDEKQIRPEQISLLNLFENIRNIRIDEQNNIWVVDGSSSLYKISPDDISESYLSNFKVYIKSVQDDQGNYVVKDNMVIEPEVTSLTFKIGVPYYLRPEEIRYQYFIKGVMNGWTEWKQSSDFDFLLQPGVHRVQVRAKNIFGNISSSREYVVKVKSPIWMHAWFIISIIASSILVFTLLFIIIQKKKERKLQRYNNELEGKVEERTQKIQKQKEQIEYKNREITDSLNYASQIQSAVLPPLKLIDNSVSESFVLNKPRDIVSGDFYWANRINGQLVVTAADCTGHGVPGAFLSMLGVTFLNEITNKMEHLEPDVILEKLRRRVIKSMHQEGYDKKRFDGIDLSMVVLDIKSNELHFSGANNPLYVIRDGELTEFKGDRMPIGIHSHSDRPFTNHKIEVEKGDIIYMFSDGFIDQFGGKYGRKFLSRNFKTLLIEISGLSLNEQNETLHETLEMWKDGRDQLDDILIVGLKI